jgi:hypothetical protein
MVLLPLPASRTLESPVPDSSCQLPRHQLHLASVAPQLRGPLPRLRPSHVRPRLAPLPLPVHPSLPNGGSSRAHPHPEAAHATAAATAWCFPQTAAHISHSGWLRSQLRPGRVCLPPQLGACTSLQPATHSRGQLVPVFRTMLMKQLVDTSDQEGR